MTKEDFDAEVYEYAKSRNGTEDSRMTDRMSAYRAGAESREKRIAELEAQIEKMKCCYNCANDTLEPPEVISNGVCENCINHSKWELEY